MIGLEDRLVRGDVIILDGATGTELEKRGVPMDHTAWSASALHTHPEVVRSVHEDYVRAGADIIIANSFSTARHVLEPAGMGSEFRSLNERAVLLAKEARDNTADRPVFVAGSISTFNAGNNPNYRPAPAQARANYRDQAAVLAESGADLIIMEMMVDLEQSGYAVEAAVLTGLPIWIGFSCKLNDEGEVLLWDQATPLTEAVRVIPPLGGSLIAIMHTLTEDVSPALRVVKPGWSGPIGVYAHSGKFIMPNWQFIDMITPDEYASAALEWVDMGAQVVGGCCGTGPEHIRALKARLPERMPGS